MGGNRGKQFSLAYEEALRRHLTRKGRTNGKSLSARKLGKNAIELDLNAIDLAHIHDQALKRIHSCPPLPQPERPQISPAALFYVEAIAPLERAHSAARNQLRQVDKKLASHSLAEGKRRNKLVEQAERQKEQVRQLTHQFLLSQEQERKEISRDLHDEIAQVLAGINVRLSALKKVIEVGSDDIGERIDHTQKLVEQSVAAVHRYALRLRPSLLDDLGLVPTLRSYIASLSEHTPISFHFKAIGKTDLLGNEQCTALYRVAQEALTNVIRHSHAQNASVKIQKRSQLIRLEIQDDGKGFDATRILKSTTHKRLGILGMRERVEMLGGTFSIRSSAAAGTTVLAALPASGKP
ncbi:sensor histidine kinase [Pelagicoccus sp. SDUM812005]|uniref:sensor histidine kinase n=1 Tax=Pelagicoccus sp. SDUM812005 TaxID=3041257 RepID=UPI00280C8B71|nr:sensor histidine kinase [Pelagicoccus sp. SDUM812005]MDQ8180775.1 sensor histidine kinase [Pelagicoccus sp. SDUM812005]